MGEALIVRRGGGGGGLENLRGIPLDSSVPNGYANKTYILPFVWWWTDEDEPEIYPGVALIHNGEVVGKWSDWGNCDEVDIDLDYHLGVSPHYSNVDCYSHGAVELTM